MVVQNFSGAGTQPFIFPGGTLHIAAQLKRKSTATGKEQAVEKERKPHQPGYA